MNTDNFSILGLTLDYGPYGFVEAYEPGFICNHTDEIRALRVRPSADDRAVELLRARARAVVAAAGVRTERGAGAYEDGVLERVCGAMRDKLGLFDVRDEDAALVPDLLDVLAARRVDWTNFWRALSEGDEPARRLLGDDEVSRAWLERYAARVRSDPRGDEGRRTAMRAHNPKYVLRNWVAQQAIEATRDRRRLGRRARCTRRAARTLRRASCARGLDAAGAARLPRTCRSAARRKRITNRIHRQDWQPPPHNRRNRAAKSLGAGAWG
jgi:uncharacterized protein YdiU (UPF0061 family)